MGPKRVMVPRSDGPAGTCWQQWSGVNPYDATSVGIDPLEHCTLQAGHWPKTPHTWQLPQRQRREHQVNHDE